MNNATVNGHFAKLERESVPALGPAVDGVLNRFNDDATRAEAGIAAVALLQALKTMGVFYVAPATQQPATLTGGGTVFAPAADGQRPKALAPSSLTRVTGE